ncbi:MAG: ABC transporter permease subunit, partial [Chloroflexi bacterium]|nr:ABC transporter permease subunit [Chloroflexota bacterium]
MDKIKTIISKEWAEVFKNRMVLFTVALLPMIFTVLPLIVLYTTRGAGAESDIGDLPGQFTRVCGALSGGECLQMYISTQFLILFMLMPLAIPATIAAYSIVGEKTSHSLEPLLATPITTIELLTGKGLAAAIPAIAVTWLAFAVFAVGAWFMVTPGVFARLVGPVWLLAVFGVGPLLAVMAVNASVIVSSRVNDPRVAEQISMVVIVPLLGLLFGQLSG